MAETFKPDPETTSDHETLSEKNAAVREIIAIGNKLSRLSKAPAKDFTVSDDELLALRARIRAILAELNAGFDDIVGGYKDGHSPVEQLKEVREALDEIDKYCVTDIIAREELNEAA